MMVEKTVEAEYRSRLSEWWRQAAAQEQAHKRMGNFRFLFAASVVILAVLLAPAGVGVGLAFVILVLVHPRPSLVGVHCLWNP